MAGASNSMFRLSVPPKTSGTHTAASAVQTAHPPIVASQSDLIHIISSGGKIVWSLDYQGVVRTNPTSPAHDAVLGRYFGATFAQAFPNLGGTDFIQVHDGSTVVYHIDNAGVAHTP